MTNARKTDQKKDFRKAIPKGMQAVEVSPETGLVAVQRLPIGIVTEADFQRTQTAAKNLLTMATVAKMGFRRP